MTLKDRLKSVLLGCTTRIRSGPLKDFRWAAISGWKFVRGAYEPDGTAIFLEHVRPEDVVFDIGAHVGYYSALASVLTGPTGRVIAFEPRPFNLRCLNLHRKLNRLSQLEIFDVCIGATTRSARFESRTGSGTGHLDANGDLQVSVVALDDWWKAGRLSTPNFVKIDVEGAEREVLEGGRTLISSSRPKLLVSLHSSEMILWVCDFLRSLDYDLRFIKGSRSSPEAELFASQTALPPDLNSSAEAAG